MLDFFLLKTLSSTLPLYLLAEVLRTVLFFLWKGLTYFEINLKSSRLFCFNISILLPHEMSGTDYPAEFSFYTGRIQGRGGAPSSLHLGGGAYVQPFSYSFPWGGFRRQSSPLYKYCPFLWCLKQYYVC